MFSGVGASSTGALLAYAQSVTSAQPAAGSKAPDVTALFRDEAQISGPAKMLGELQQLQSQDPSRFRELAMEISRMLSSASQEVTGGQGVLLSDLAARFQTAALTGTLTGVLA